VETGTLQQIEIAGGCQYPKPCSQKHITVEQTFCCASPTVSTVWWWHKDRKDTGTKLRTQKQTQVCLDTLRKATLQVIKEDWGSSVNGCLCEGKR
jgi:hypothetical protein